MSPRIKSTLARGIEPIEGQAYIIKTVKEATTQVQGFKGYRVELEPEKRKAKDEDEYTTMLWASEEAGVKSKLGAFMAGFLEFLGDEDTAFDTDNWIEKKIRIASWKPKDRAITVLE